MDEAQIRALVEQLVAQGLIDPATVEQLTGLATLPQERAGALRQIRRGQDLYQTPGAEGMRVGGTYKAAHPLEHLSVALQRGMGGYNMRKGEEAMAATYPREQAGARAMYGLQAQNSPEIRSILDAILGQQQERQQAPGLPMYGPGF